MLDYARTVLADRNSFLHWRTPVHQYMLSMSVRESRDMLAKPQQPNGFASVVYVRMHMKDECVKYTN